MNKRGAIFARELTEENDKSGNRLKSRSISLFNKNNAAIRLNTGENVETLIKNHTNGESLSKN